MQSDRDLLKQALEAMVESRTIPSSADDDGLSEAITALRERLAQPEQKRPQNCGTSYCSCIECVMEPKQPEQSPLDRMAENARELGLDYEPTSIAVRKVWWDGDTLRAEAIPPEQVYKQPEQEPVAWWLPKHPHPDMVSRVKWSDECEPLYTTPPRREWEHLTWEEIDECFKITPDQYLSAHIYKRIFNKLKEKNA